MKHLLAHLNQLRRFARGVYAPHRLALRQDVPKTLRSLGVKPMPVQPARARFERQPALRENTAPRLNFRAPRFTEQPPEITDLETALEIPENLEPSLAMDDAANLRDWSEVREEPLEEPLEEPVALEGEPEAFSAEQDAQTLEETTPEPNHGASAVLEARDLSSEATRNEARTTEPPRAAETFDASSEPTAVVTDTNQPSSLELARAETVNDNRSKTEESILATTTLNESTIIEASRVSTLESASSETSQTPSSLVTPESITVAPPEPLESTSPRASLHASATPTQMPEIISETTLESERAASPTPIQDAMPDSDRSSAETERPEGVSSDAPQLEASPLEVTTTAETTPSVSPIELSAEPNAESTSSAMLAQLEALRANTETRAEPSLAPNLMTAASEIAPARAEPSAVPETITTPKPAEPVRPSNHRVVEEYIARPPPNMPPRKPKAPPPEPTPASDEPSRPREEWARLLKETFGSLNPTATPPTNGDALEANPNPASLEPRAGDTVQPGRTSPRVVMPNRDSAQRQPTSSDSNLSNVTSSNQPSIPAEVDMSGIPEDFSQRTASDWGNALGRFFARAQPAQPDSSSPAPSQSPAPRPSSVAPVQSRVVEAPVQNRNAARRLEPNASSVSTQPRRFVEPRRAQPASPPPAPFNARVANPNPTRVTPPAASERRLEQSLPETAQAQRAALSDSPNLRRLIERNDPASAEPRLESVVTEETVQNLEAAHNLETTPSLETARGEALPLKESAELQTASLEPRTLNDAHNDLQESSRNDTTPTQIERITQTTNLEPSVTTPPSPDLERVELSGAARRFLEPLVGFDPSEVPVLRGNTAERIAQNERADALAVDGNVILRDATNLETPEQLGLLAHELIHVPQQRRFVAPVSAPILEDQPAWTDEETRARLAETRVERLARDAPASAQPATPTPDGNTARWNGLPAPWEPMPSLEFGDTTTAEPSSKVVSLIGSGFSDNAWGDAVTTTPPDTSSGYSPNVSSSASSAPSSTASSGAQLADEARAAPAEGGGESGGDQDIDQLARQVYDVLKRKLQHERRRGGF